MGLFYEVGFFSSEYAARGLIVAPGSLPGALLMGLLSEPFFISAFGLGLIFLPLLFPDGRLPSPRWKPIAWVTAVTLALAALFTTLMPGPIDEDNLPVANPIGIEGAEGILEALSAILFMIFAVLVGVSVVSLVLRLRRSRGEERRQVKLFAASSATLAAAFLLDGILQPVVPGWGPIAPLIAIPAVPIAAYFALVREGNLARRPTPVR